MAVNTPMWIATRTFGTPMGTVTGGRVVHGGDPLIDAAPDPTCWARIVLEVTPFEEDPVVETTANPGERRPTRGRKA